MIKRKELNRKWSHLLPFASFFSLVKLIIWIIWSFWPLKWMHLGKPRNQCKFLFISNLKMKTSKHMYFLQCPSVRLSVHAGNSALVLLQERCCCCRISLSLCGSHRILYNLLQKYFLKQVLFLKHSAPPSLIPNAYHAKSLPKGQENRYWAPQVHKSQTAMHDPVMQ